MFRKKNLLWSIMFLLSTTLVSAQNMWDGVFQPFLDLLQYLFITLPDNNPIVYFKALLFFLFGILFMTIVPRIPPFKSKTGGADPNIRKYAMLTSWILSAIIIVFIPEAIIELFRGFMMILGPLLVIAIIVGVILASTSKSDNTRLRGIVYIIAGIIFLFFINALLGQVNISDNFLTTLFSIFRLIGLVLLVYGIILLFRRSADEVEHASEEAVRKARAHADRVKGVGEAGRDTVLNTGRIATETMQGLHDNNMKNELHRTKETLKSIKHDLKGDAEVIENLGRVDSKDTDYITNINTLVNNLVGSLKQYEEVDANTLAKMIKSAINTINNLGNLEDDLSNSLNSLKNGSRYLRRRVGRISTLSARLGTHYEAMARSSHPQISLIAKDITELEAYIRQILNKDMATNDLQQKIDDAIHTYDDMVKKIMEKFRTIANHYKQYYAETDMAKKERYMQDIKNNLVEVFKITTHIFGDNNSASPTMGISQVIPIVQSLRQDFAHIDNLINSLIAKIDQLEH